MSQEKEQNLIKAHLELYNALKAESEAAGLPFHAEEVSFSSNLDFDGDEDYSSVPRSATLESVHPEKKIESKATEKGDARNTFRSPPRRKMTAKERMQRKLELKREQAQEALRLEILKEIDQGKRSAVADIMDKLDKDQRFVVYDGSKDKLHANFDIPKRQILQTPTLGTFNGFQDNGDESFTYVGSNVDDDEESSTPLMGDHPAIDDILGWMSKMGLSEEVMGNLVSDHVSSTSDNIESIFTGKGSNSRSSLFRGMSLLD